VWLNIFSPVLLHLYIPPISREVKAGDFGVWKSFDIFLISFPSDYSNSRRVYGKYLDEKFCLNLKFQKLCKNVK
jgi:hypothetical protein